MYAMFRYTKMWILGVLLSAPGNIGVIRANVTFTRVTVDSNRNTPHGVWAEDIDGNSPQYALDIFATIGYAGEAVWYENIGSVGTSWSSKHLIWTATANPYNFEIAGADLDGDGDVDAVSTDFGVSSSSTGYLALHINNGTSPVSFTTTILDNVSGRFRQMRLRDVNGDGNTDIVIAVNTQQSQAGIGVYWYENDGNLNPTFTRHKIGNANAWKVDCFDDEGDGHLEIVVSERFHGSSSTTANQRLIFYKNNGSEIFTPTTLYSTSSGGVEDGVAGVGCADLDNDGKIDIISGNSTNGNLFYYKNLGSGSFIEHIIESSTCSRMDGIDIGDFEPDGDIDIVVAGRNYCFKWYENDGNGNFTPHTIDTEYKMFDLPYVSYFDGDTCPDIVLTEASSSGHIFVYLNACPTGTEETELTPNKNWLKVPSLVSSGSVNLEYGIEKTTSVRLELIDIMGRLVQVLDESPSREPRTYRTGWNIQKEPNGIYFLMLTGDNLHIVKKVIVLR